MKELATLALVILPLGMTIVECLAADDTPEQHDQGRDVHTDAGREEAATPAAETTGTGPRGNRPSYASGLDGDAVPRKPA